MEGVALAGVSLTLALINALILNRSIERVLTDEFELEGLGQNTPALHVSVRVGQALVTKISFITTSILTVMSFTQTYAKLDPAFRVVLCILLGTVLVYYYTKIAFDRAYQLHFKSNTFRLSRQRPLPWSLNTEINAVMVILALGQLLLCFVG